MHLNTERFPKQRFFLEKIRKNLKSCIGSGHITVRRGERRSQLPMHGSRKKLGTKLVNKILKDLGLK